jgi:hypothetical protein
MGSFLSPEYEPGDLVWPLRELVAVILREGTTRVRWYWAASMTTVMS